MTLLEAIFFVGVLPVLILGSIAFFAVFFTERTKAKRRRIQHVSRDFDNYCSVDYAGYFDAPDGILGPAVLPEGRPLKASPRHYVEVPYFDW